MVSRHWPPSISSHPPLWMATAFSTLAAPISLDDWLLSENPYGFSAGFFSRFWTTSNHKIDDLEAQKPHRSKYNESTWYQGTLPKTNSSPLKMMVFNRNLQTSRGPPFSGAFAVSFREGIWVLSWWIQAPLHNACSVTKGTITTTFRSVDKRPPSLHSLKYSKESAVFFLSSSFEIK